MTTINGILTSMSCLLQKPPNCVTVASLYWLLAISMLELVKFLAWKIIIQVQIKIPHYFNPSCLRWICWSSTLYQYKLILSLSFPDLPILASLFSPSSPFCWRPLLESTKSTSITQSLCSLLPMSPWSTTLDPRTRHSSRTTWVSHSYTSVLYSFSVLFRSLSSSCCNNNISSFNISKGRSSRSWRY